MMHKMHGIRMVIRTTLIRNRNKASRITTIKAILPGGFVRVNGVLQLYYRRRRAAVLDIQCILFGVVDWFL